MTADLAVNAAAYRQNLSFVEALQRETEYEYTSKVRLRHIARQTLATLAAGYAEAAAVAEQALAAEAESSGLLVLPSEVTP